MLKGDVVADVGSDHAHLPIWLYLNKKAKKSYALDISAKCVEKTKANLKKHGIPETAVVPVVSDGLSCFGSLYDFAELTDIVIAGMGGESIARIIENMKKTNDEKNLQRLNIVLQPNSKIISLKKYLRENSFEIAEETTIEDKHRLYAIIKTKFKPET